MRHSWIVGSVLVILHDIRRGRSDENDKPQTGKATGSTKRKPNRATRINKLGHQFPTSQDRMWLTCNTGDFVHLHHEWLPSGRAHSEIVDKSLQGLSID